MHLVLVLLFEFFGGVRGRDSCACVALLIRYRVPFLTQYFIQFIWDWSRNNFVHPCVLMWRPMDWFANREVQALCFGVLVDMDTKRPLLIHFTQTFSSQEDQIHLSWSFSRYPSSHSKQMCKYLAIKPLHGVCYLSLSAPTSFPPHPHTILFPPYTTTPPFIPSLTVTWAELIVRLDVDMHPCTNRCLLQSCQNSVSLLTLLLICKQTRTDA